MGEESSRAGNGDWASAEAPPSPAIMVPVATSRAMKRTGLRATTALVDQENQNQQPDDDGGGADDDRVGAAGELTVAG